MMLPSVSRRAALLAAVAAVTPLAPPHAVGAEEPLGLLSGRLRSCPKAANGASPIAVGCVASLPQSAPNQYMAPLRYGKAKDEAFRDLRAALSTDDTVRLIEAASPDYVHAYAVCRRPGAPFLEDDHRDLRSKLADPAPPPWCRAAASTATVRSAPGSNAPRRVRLAKRG